MSMIRIATFSAAFVLVVHGLIHLMGTAVYARHAEFKGLSYKTTLLSGHWELREGGDSRLRLVMGIARDWLRTCRIGVASWVGLVEAGLDRDNPFVACNYDRRLEQCLHGGHS